MPPSISSRPSSRKAEIAKNLIEIDNQLKETEYGQLKSDLTILQELYKSIKILEGTPEETAGVSAAIGLIKDSIKNTTLNGIPAFAQLLSGVVQLLLSVTDLIPGIVKLFFGGFQLILC